MNNEFIGREKELELLERLYNSSNFEFLIMYGRRRVGKTEILKEFSKKHKTIFFSAQEKNDMLNLQDFSILLQEKYDNNSYGKFENWEKLFKYFVSKATEKKEKQILIIDEFPYLLKSDISIRSILQHIIDHDLKNKNVLIILCGSSVSYMEDELLSYKSPLYGRTTAQIEVLPLDYYDASKYMKNSTISNKILCYGILGGIPYYLNQFDYSKSVLSNIQNKILVSSSILYDEPQTLLKMELREPSVYNSIFEAIATGKNKVNEISNFIGEECFKCTKYLDTLKTLRLVNKNVPCMEKDISRKSAYRIKDNYFTFWFRYISRNKSYYELLGTKKSAEEIFKDLPDFMGNIFEKICEEYLIRMAKLNHLPFVPLHIGKWWGNNKIRKCQDDIDILLVDKTETKAIFCECKYRNEKFNISYYNDLVEVSENFSNIKEKYFYLFSKSGFTKEVENIKLKNVKLITIDKLFELKKPL